jgi:hypothetical protein
MAKPIDHSTTSAAATVGWGVVKGGLAGALVVGLGSALLGGLVIGGIASMLPVIAGAATTIGIIGGIVTGISAFGSAGTIGTVVGGILGALSGGSRIHKENSAFREKMENGASHQAVKQQNASLAGMQQGYMVGFQEGQQSVVSQLQRAQEEMLMAQAAPKAGFAANCGKCESHAETVIKQRAAQAAAGNQIG